MQIQDLLRPESCNMQIREGDNGVYVSGVEEVQVKSVEDSMKLLMLGDRNRCFAFTKLVEHVNLFLLNRRFHENEFVFLRLEQRRPGLELHVEMISIIVLMLNRMHIPPGVTP